MLCNTNISQNGTSYIHSRKLPEPVLHPTNIFNKRTRAKQVRSLQTKP